MLRFVVLCDDGAGLRDGGLGVVREARVYLSGYAAGNDGQDSPAEGDGQPLEGEIGDGGVGCARAEFLAGLLQHDVHNELVLRHLRRGGNQRRISGCVLRAKLLHRLDVAGIGYDHRVRAQLFQQILWHMTSQGAGFGD